MDLDLLCNPSRLKERNIRDMRPKLKDKVTKPNTKINTYVTPDLPKSKHININTSIESESEIDTDIHNAENSSTSSEDSSVQNQSDIETDISASIDTDDSIDINTYLNNINKTYNKYNKYKHDTKKKDNYDIHAHLTNNKSISSLITTITYLSDTLNNIIISSKETTEMYNIYDKSQYYDDIIINEYRKCYVYNIKINLGYST